MKVAALIPCRTGSKGIPNKNFKDFCGAPLYMWTLNEAVRSGVFDKIILSSDGGFSLDEVTIYSPSVKVEKPPMEVDNDRPEKFSTDKADLDSLLVYYSEKYPEIEMWCLLQPTSPLRTAQDIKDAYAMMQLKREDGYDEYESLVSVYEDPVMAWRGNAVGVPDCDTKQPIALYHYLDRPNRQVRKDWYIENGAIYFTHTYILKYFKKRLHGSIGLYVMPKERSFEIDEPLDWFITENVKEGWLDAS